MCISGLIVSQNSGAAIRDRFPGAEGTNELFNSFESSNEEIMGKEQKEEVLW